MYKLAIVAVPAIVLVTAGVFFLDKKSAEVNRISSQQKQVDPLPIKPVISGKPVSINIPRQGVDIAVVDGMYDPGNKTWTLGKKTAQYAANTPLANDTAGNTFIYGHNNWQVFGNLLNIRPGDEVVLSTAEGTRFYYIYRTSFDVKPNQVSSIKHEGAPILTLQTCVGQYFEHRRMFQFDFSRADS